MKKIEPHHINHVPVRALEQLPCDNATGKTSVHVVPEFFTCAEIAKSCLIKQSL